MALDSTELLPVYEQQIQRAKTLDDLDRICEQILDQIISRTRGSAEQVLARTEEPPEIDALLHGLVGTVWKKLSGILSTLKEPTIAPSILALIGVKVSFSANVYAPQDSGQPRKEFYEHLPTRNNVPVDALRIVQMLVDEGITPGQIELDIGQPSGRGNRQSRYARLRIAGSAAKDLLIPYDSHGAIYIGENGEFSTGWQSKLQLKESAPYVTRKSHLPTTWISILRLGIFCTMEEKNRILTELKALGPGFFLQGMAQLYRTWPDKITFREAPLSLVGVMWILHEGRGDPLQITASPHWNDPMRRRILASLYGPDSDEIRVLDDLVALHQQSTEQLAATIRRTFPSWEDFKKQAYQPRFDLAWIICKREGAEGSHRNEVLKEILDSTKAPKLGLRLLGKKFGAPKDQEIVTIATRVYPEEASGVIKRSDTVKAAQSTGLEAVQNARPRLFFQPDGQVDQDAVGVFLGGDIPVNESPFSADQGALRHLSYDFIHKLVAGTRCAGYRKKGSGIVLTRKDKNTILGIWGIDPKDGVEQSA